MNGIVLNISTRMSLFVLRNTQNYIFYYKSDKKNNVCESLNYCLIFREKTKNLDLNYPPSHKKTHNGSRNTDLHSYKL